MNKKEYVTMSFHLTRSLFLGWGFSCLVNLCKRDVLICGILGLIVGYFLLYFFYKRNVMAKGLDVIISILSIVIMLLGFGILISNYLLVSTPLLLIFLPMIIVIIYSSSKGINSLFRLSFVLFYVSIIVISFIVLGIFKYVDFICFLPLFKTNICNNVIGVLIFSIVSIMPNISLLRYKDNLSFKDVSIGYVMGYLSIMIIFYCIVGIYGIPYATYLRYPEYSVLKSVELFSYVHSLENVFVIEWFINVFISLSFNYYILYRKFKLVGVSILSIIFIILMYLLFNNYPLVLIVKDYICYVFILVVIWCFFSNKKRRTI